MEIIDRPIRSRSILIASAAALATAVGGQPLIAEASERRTPLVGQRPGRRPVVGCGGDGCGDCVACDAMEAARVAAERCLGNNGANPRLQDRLANNVARPWQNVDPMKITPENCQRYGLRYVPVGVSNGDALVANAGDSLDIVLRANFLPYMHVVTPAATAAKINFTQIDYQLQPMFIGGIVNGEMFISTAANGGYRLPTKRWLGNQDVITYNFTPLAAFAADALQVMAYGFTDALG